MKRPTTAAEVVAPHLLEADASFAATRDVLEALGWVALAAENGAALPPRIGKWLSEAIRSYTSGAVESMDIAFGLNVSGKGNPRRKRDERNRLERALADVLLLHVLGASIAEAAEMAAQVHGYAEGHLESRYKRSPLKLGRQALKDRRSLPWRAQEIEALIEKYPDNEQTKAGKASIRKVYSKRLGFDSIAKRARR